MLKKIGKVLGFVWKWLVYSSENAQRISLMVKGIGMAIIPAILIVTNMFNVKTDNAQLTLFIDSASTIIIVIGGMIATVVTAIGAIRKIVSSFTGTNDVVATYAPEVIRELKK